MSKSSKDCKGPHDYQPLITPRPKKRSLLRKIWDAICFRYYLDMGAYSKCSKCGLWRHDKDGHTFRTVEEAVRSAEK